MLVDVANEVYEREENRKKRKDKMRLI